MNPAGPVLLLGALDSLWIMVLLALGSAVVEWLQRRRQRQSGENPTPDVEPPPEGPRPVRRPEDWQEELRRLLEGETPPPRSEPPSPPVVVIPSSPPPPAPLREVPEPAAPPVIRPDRPVVVSAPRPVVDWEAAEAPTAPLAHLRESAAAHRRAKSLEAATIDRLRAASAIGDHAPQAAPTRHVQPLSPDAAQVRAWLSSPRTARQAVMASVILGPPRGLDT